MSKEEAIKILISVLTEIQEMSDEQAVAINDKTKPYNDLPGFDSVRRVECIVTIESNYDLNFKTETDLFFQKGKFLNLEEAAKELCKIAKDKK